MRYEDERREIIECARCLERLGLVKLSGGNVSLKVDDDLLLVTPSAMGYDSMAPNDIVLVNLDGEVIEGIRRPTSDISAILYIVRNMSRVNAVIHTHQPNAVAVSLVTDQLPVISTTQVDEIHGAVAVAPFTVSSDEGMGIETVKHAGDSSAVTLKQHGAMTFGEDLDEALSAAVYLEETCQIYMSDRTIRGEVPTLTQEQIEAEDAPRGYYGQP